jgi:hypothetical protein
MVTRPLRLFPIKKVFETALYVISHLYRNMRNWKQKCFHQLFHFNFDSMTIRFVLADEPKLFFLDDCYFFSFFSFCPFELFSLSIQTTFKYFPSSFYITCLCQFLCKYISRRRFFFLFLRLFYIFFLLPFFYSYSSFLFKLKCKAPIKMRWQLLTLSFSFLFLFSLPIFISFLYFPFVLILMLSFILPSLICVNVFSSALSLFQLFCFVSLSLHPWIHYLTIYLLFFNSFTIFFSSPFLTLSIHLYLGVESQNSITFHYSSSVLFVCNFFHAFDTLT